MQVGASKELSSNNDVVFERIFGAVVWTVVHVCEVGSTFWWNQATGVDPTQPLTLTLTLNP